MPIITRQKIWIFGDILTASELNNEFNNIVNILNGNLDQDNLGVLQTLVVTNPTAAPAVVITSTGGGNALEIG
jgi:hypothetical protein